MTETRSEGRLLRVGSLDEFQDVAQALALEPRRRILELLRTGDLNVSQIAAALETPIPTVTLNVQKLEAAGLVRTDLRAGRRGTQRICSLRYDRILLDFSTDSAGSRTEVATMPIGHFAACEVRPSCGMAGADDLIGRYDDPRTFYLPEARDAQLIWFTTGFVEYRFPNPLREDAEATAVEFVAELCSEAPFFKNNWRSSIRLSINDVALGTWTSAGDFGGRRGRFTPKWWGIHKTQFGVQTRWRVDGRGVTVNGDRLSDVLLADLRLGDRPFVSVRIAVDPESEFPHGLNLFGRRFGNYDDDLLLLVEHAADES